jgi:TonB family protein
VFSLDGDVCKTCQQVFAPVLGTATVTQPSNDSATASAQKTAAIDTMAEAALPPPVAKIDAVKIPAAADTAKAEMARAETARAVADLTAQAHLARAKNATVVNSNRRPIVPAPAPQRRSRTPMLVTAAAVIVVVIGAAEGGRRLGFLPLQQAAREEQPVHAARPVKSVTVTPPGRPASHSDTHPAGMVVAENRAPAIAPAKAAPLPKPKPSAAAVRRQPAGQVKQAKSSDQRAVPVVAADPRPEITAPVPTSTPAVAAVAPRASTPPSGRFFERNDVDEPPQVATRVEPKLPPNVPARLRNGTVVVRVLVSRTGHPFQVSLLRRSMLGRPSDEAVVAAVTQWTFSPARKRGEPVNCWFNIGVPLGQAN